MAMIDRLEKAFQVFGSFVLRKEIVALFANLVVEGHPFDILHDEVDVLGVVVGLVVLHDVRVVQRVQRVAAH